MPANGWWHFTDNFQTRTYIDNSLTTALISGGAGTGVSGYGNSNRITWDIPNSGFTINKDGSGNIFNDWGNDVYDGFGNFCIEYGGTSYPLNVAPGNAENGQWFVANYEVGPYMVQVDTSYMGLNIYRMTVCEVSGQRPELIFRMNGNMGSDNSTNRWYHTFSQNAFLHYYAVNVQNSADPLYSNGDAVVYMTVVPMGGSLGNLFGGSGDGMTFNEVGTPIRLPFTVYICAHNGGSLARDSFFAALANDLKQTTSSGSIIGTSQVVSTEISIPRMRELWFDADDVVQGNGSIAYQMFLGGQWKAVAKGQCLRFALEQNIRLKATISVPNSNSDAKLHEWRLQGYENQEGIFHG